MAKSMEEKQKDLEIMDKLVSKSKLTQKDVDEISRKIKREMFKDFNKR